MANPDWENQQIAETLEAWHPDVPKEQHRLDPLWTEFKKICSTPNDADLLVWWRDVTDGIEYFFLCRHLEFTLSVVVTNDELSGDESIWMNALFNVLKDTARQAKDNLASRRTISSSTYARLKKPATTRRSASDLLRGVRGV